jgi:hypothetical protein
LVQSTRSHQGGVKVVRPVGGTYIYLKLRDKIPRLAILAIISK